MNSVYVILYRTTYLDWNPIDGKYVFTEYEDAMKRKIHVAKMFPNSNVTIFKSL